MPRLGVVDLADLVAALPGVQPIEADLAECAPARSGRGRPADRGDGRWQSRARPADFAGGPRQRRGRLPDRTGTAASTRIEYAARDDPARP
jgi:hypothetical protein